MQKKEVTITTSAIRGEAEKMTQEQLGFEVATAGDCKVSYGRTISLGKYQFARIGVSVEGHSFDAIDFVAKEILNREIACLDRQEYEKIDLSDEAVTRVSIDYGLTLKIKGYESGKIDVGLSRSINEDLSVEDAISHIQRLTSERLNEEAKTMGLLASAKELTSLRRN